MPVSIHNLLYSSSGTVASELWVDLGTIPSGFAIWFGTMQATSPNKSITFEVRSNLSGQSTGTTGTTVLHGAVSVAPRNGTKILDMYKNGRLHTASVVGTGAEKVWLRLVSKGAAGSYTSKIYYTTE